MHRNQPSELRERPYRTYLGVSRNFVAVIVQEIPRRVSLLQSIISSTTASRSITTTTYLSSPIHSGGGLSRNFNQSSFFLSLHCFKSYNTVNDGSV